MTRAQLIHAARVYLAQSRHFRARARGFSFWLLDRAAKARREAAQLGNFIQQDFFGAQT